MSTTVNTNNPYNLSIRFSSDGFYLYITDDKRKQISSNKVACDCMNLSEDVLSDVLSNVPEFGLNYSSVDITIESEQYTVIPAPLFSETHMSDYLKLQHSSIKDNTPILFNKLAIWNAVVIFSCPIAIEAVVRKILPEIELTHHLVDFANNSISLQNSSSMNVNVRKTLIDVFVTKSGLLTLVNTYKYNSNEDFLYHIMNIYDQLSLDTENCGITLHNLHNKNDLQELISKYIRNCKVQN